MTTPNYETMSLDELRQYVLAHRAEHIARLRREPGVIRYRGGLNEADLQQLEQWFAQPERDQH